MTDTTESKAKRRPSKSMLSNLVSWWQDERTYTGTFFKKGIFGEEIAIGTHSFTTTKYALETMNAAQIGFYQNYKALSRYCPVGSDGLHKFRCEYEAN